MENNRRSGSENLKQPSKEKRELLNEPDQTMERFKKIPMFRGLATEQLKKMLCICAKKVYPNQEHIFRSGEESNNMFILLKGKISIMFDSGIELQSISPAGTVGEMGIFTGEKRSASVFAVSDCTVLNFNKEEMFKLFSKDNDLSIKILLNVIKDLSQRIRKDNDQLEEMLIRIRSLDLV